jgi:hypothetical protein
MELVFAEPSLASLDAAAVDALALFIAEGERPLRRLAGLCDWRMCGAISRVVQADWFQGQAGEVMLMPSAGKLPAPRLFLFGLGKRDEPSDQSLGRSPGRMPGLIPKAFEVIRRAGGHSLGMELPWEGMALESSVAIWASAAATTRQRLERACLFGEARALQRGFAADPIGRSLLAPALERPVTSPAAVPHPAERR